MSVQAILPHALSKRQANVRPLVVGPNEDSREVMAGDLWMVHKCGGESVMICVHVRVYRGPYDHFMIIHRDKRSSHNSVYVSLKNSRAGISDECDNGFYVIPDSREGSEKLTFKTDEKNNGEWLSALESPLILTKHGGSISPKLSPVIPRSPLMPTLAEDEEPT